MGHFSQLFLILLHILIFALNSQLGSCSFSTSSSNPLTQQNLDRISYLPGQNFDAEFAQYSGYVTVNQEFGRALFYWLIEAVEGPSSKPLLLWLNGGPGCSSIAYGEAEELGPFHIEKDGKTLYLNPHSWNKVANILFLDSPAGVGFSYSNTTSDLLSHGDKSTAQDSLKFLLEWFERFPHYKGREFYISGESYGGHYVPQLSQAIVRHNLESNKKTINLKGYMVGNALTDDFYDHVGVFQFMWSSGLISDETYKMLNVFCDFESFINESDKCGKIIDIANNELGNIDPYSIYTPSCTANSSSPNKLLKRLMIGHINEAYDPCSEKHSVVYFNNPEVQQALHVNPKFAPEKWETCSEVIFSNWKDSSRSVLDIYHELIAAGLRIWIFSGDTDSVIPVTSTRYSIDALRLPTVKPWRAWYDDGQVGGWTEEYKGLTFVVIRGAGHEVPLHRSKLSLTLIKSFLAGESMPALQQLSDS
ncbi:hypothetical protein SOVF_075210 [Spinacia oleracea]|uniref:Carboxypeptidase n=1 Tax=Spinacia oleracea TaxID=3562 RepID=A0A9R0IN35_SPIOL|nr:serine carboxypeptidase II-2 [Spinacia oleracea]KNA17955.1 hypothetical protein SOVF_075210 [Spinacia oleracea]